MIPILYDKNETAFIDNGIGRLNSCISCTVIEERNGVYECDFEYPIGGDHYEDIQVGRIIAVTHDDTGDVQPFDIVGATKPISGVVTYHCTHISYRQSYITCTTPAGSIGTINDAFLSFESRTTPTNPFTYYWYDLPTQFGYMAAADGLPHSVRQMLGGMEGSVLDTFGGEYQFDKFKVNLYAQRGTIRDFTIRYGVNMLEYNDEVNIEGAYSAVVPYWVNGEERRIGSRVTSGSSTPTGRGETVPLDLTDKFETKPTATELTTAARTYMRSNTTYLPAQNISVSFLRIQDTPEYQQFADLLGCQLCDTIRVVFPDYDTSAYFKIVKVTWDALSERYTEMELGELSTSLSEAISTTTTPDRTSSTFNSLSVTGDAYIGGRVYQGGHSSPIGAYTASSAASVNLANAASWASTGQSFTPTEGTYIVFVHVYFASNSTGRRAIRVYASDTGALGMTPVSCTAVNGLVTHMQTSFSTSTDGTRTYTIQYEQTSGNVLNNCEVQYVYIRLV